MEALVDCATQRLPIPQVQYNCRHGRQFDEIYDQRATRDVDGILGKYRWGRWEVKSKDGTRTHSFANDKELWRWTYVLAIDGVD
jgi:hypothetical protein